MLLPTPFLPRFCLALSSILSTEFEFELYGISSPCNCHIVRFGPNILILSQSGKHPFSVLLRVYKSWFHHVVPSNVKPCNGFEFSHSSSSTSQNVVHSSLADPLYTKEVYFCSFVTKSNNPV